MSTERPNREAVTWKRCGRLSGRSAIASTDGRFVIPQVTPGEYLLSAGLYRVGASLSGMTKVRVGQQDVDG